MAETTVFRVVRRRVKPGCAQAYEALVGAMLADAQRFPGYVSAELIPPAAPEGEYQIIQRFAHTSDLECWQASPIRAAWMARLATVADGEPEYRLLHGLDAWFGPTLVPAHRMPRRWKMTLLSWCGIFPTVALLLAFVAPLLSGLPFLARTAVITALVAVLMSYVIMPRLTRLAADWLRG
jgi:antibiotic biosynthesis monooxygenase (ABM) superfamily enzyme